MKFIYFNCELKQFSLHALSSRLSIIVLNFNQATLQYCVIKPLMAAITLILQPMGYYSDGDWRYFYRLLRDYHFYVSPSQPSVRMSRVSIV